MAALLEKLYTKFPLRPGGQYLADELYNYEVLCSTGSSVPVGSYLTSLSLTYKVQRLVSHSYPHL